MLKKVLNLIIIFQFFLIVALGCLGYYLYKIRVIEQISYKEVRVDITNNSITKTQAESLTLDSVIQKKENPNFKENYLVNSASSKTGDGVITQPIYKIEGESIIKSTDININAVPSFYVELNSQNLEDSRIVEQITTVIKKDNLSEIDIDVSITNKVGNIEKVVKDIIYALNPSDLKITLGLPLKWSDNIDYSYLDSVSRFYKSSASIEVLNNLCNKFRVDSFGYTSINSANVGPITQLQIAQDTVKYYIYKGLHSNKIDLMINKTGYLWDNRSYSENYLYNYVLDTQQSVIINSEDLNNYLSQSNFTNLESFDNGESLGVIQNNGNIKYLIYPKLTQSTTLIEIARSYGLNGFIYKNF